jgi:hypothetical protein
LKASSLYDLRLLISKSGAQNPGFLEKGTNIADVMAAMKIKDSAGWSSW